MIRYVAMTCILLVLAPVQAALAEIEKVAVTPEYLKANPDVIRVKTVHDDKVGRFEVRLRLEKPQYVTTLLVTACGDTEQIFKTASVITESETTVKFSVAMKSIAHSTLHLGVGGYDLKDGIAKPWLGGTSYVITLRDFVTGTAAGAGEPGGSIPSGGDGGLGAAPSKPGPKDLSLDPAASEDPFAKPSKLAKDGGIAFLLHATARGDDVIPSEIADQIKKNGLVEIHAASDKIDTSRVIVFLGKRGKVEVRPGTSIFTELARPTNEFYWQAGDVPEGVGDAELPAKFTHVWCRWSPNGDLKWTCYGHPANDRGGIQDDNNGAEPDADRTANQRIRAFLHIHKTTKADEILKLTIALSRVCISIAGFEVKDKQVCVLELLCPEDFPAENRVRLEREVRTELDGMPDKWTVNWANSRSSKRPVRQ